MRPCPGMIARRDFESPLPFMLERARRRRAVPTLLAQRYTHRGLAGIASTHSHMVASIADTGPFTGNNVTRKMLMLFKPQ
jgi:hypothetical protein